MRHRHHLILCALVLLLTACDGSPESDEDTRQEADSASDTPPQDTAPQDAPPEVTEVDFGFDTRPANASCVAPPRPPTGASVALERAWPALTFTQPLWLTRAPGAPDTLYVLEQPGRVQRFTDDPAVDAAEVALDITDRVDAGGEMGLLGMAFHPDFQNNGALYLSYTTRADGIESRISRFTTSDGGLTFDPGSEAILLRIPQPAANHNGGQLTFGPDGLLYIAVGDGGGANDSYGNGQNTDTPLGAILRVDVDTGDPYAIPPDNPFADGGGAPEIFAWGLRNPWRFSFDSQTGDLWVGDVGQNAYEEISRVELGGNYGWPIMEGDHCFPDDGTCDRAGLIPPVVDYNQEGNGRSVTGGFVYHGSTIPALRGSYVFGDFISGNIWTIAYDETTGAPRMERLLESGLNIASFAEDTDGALYVLAYDGTLHRFVEASPTEGPAFPRLLSELGCFDPDDPTRVAEGVIPYELNRPFWSDGASKRRFFALPDGATIGVGDDGDLDLPIGSVTIKSFYLGGRPFETRVMVRHDDGAWAGYTYAWREDGADAELLDAGRTAQVEGQTWSYPSRSECLSCHTSAAGHTLGLELRQLDRDALYPGARRAPQLETLTHIGLLDATLPDVPALPAPDDADASDSDHARAYLHVNCSVCHRAGGPTPTPLDVFVDTPLAESGLCDVAQAGDMGLGDGARIVEPGDPASSLLSNRVRRRDAFAMPPLGSHRVDADGADTLDRWIGGLQSCP